jgi:hypothetical protein
MRFLRKRSICVARWELSQVTRRAAHSALRGHENESP